MSLLTVAARAQSDSDQASEFLEAYTLCDKADKLEHAGSRAEALRNYKEAARILDSISSRWPNWSPQVLSYRKKKTTDAIARLSSGGGAELVPPDALVPGIPGGASPLEPALPDNGPMPVAPPEPPARKKGGNVAQSDPIKAIQEELTELRADNGKLKSEIDKLHQERKEMDAEVATAKAERKQADEKLAMTETRWQAEEEKLNQAIKAGVQDKETIKKLTEARDKARKDFKDLQIEYEAQAMVRTDNAARLSNFEARANDMATRSKQAEKLSAEAAARIKEATDKMNQAITERDTYKAKLTAMTQQRDDALKQVEKFKNAQAQIDKLVTENTHLMAQLADAQKMISDFKAEGAQKDATIADLTKNLGSVKQQLVDAKKESSEYQARMSEMKAKLDATASDLSAMKNDNSTAGAERKKMQEENELLRGIVLREMKEQARRDQTKKLVLDEMSKLNVKSEELIKQISYLGQPVVKLTPKERGMFKKPQVEVTDNEITLTASRPDDSANTADAGGTNEPPSATADVKPQEPLLPAGASAPEPVAANPPPAAPAPAPESPKPAVADAKPPTAPPKSPAPAAPVASAEEPKHTLSLDGPIKESLTSSSVPDATTAMVTNSGNAKPGSADQRSHEPSPGGPGDGGSKGVGGSLSSAMIPVMQQAKDEFERGNYRDSEKLYERVLLENPDNLNALDNLGVVCFRSSKLKKAEETFKKAIALAPDDGFSHCTLGIVQYSQQRFDEAVNELTKALAINPKNATAHNYLGITASQKGWQEAAQKELESAVAIDPSYADAWFNLAVVFATQQPSNKDAARKAYKKAVSLGAEPDSSLEQLLK